MPKAKKISLVAPVDSRTLLDQKLAETYAVSPRTIRLWRRKGAPLDEPGEMADWIADLRHKGKADSVDVRAARLRKLTLQIEALEIQDRKVSDAYIAHAKVVSLVEPLCVYLRQSLRELLVEYQPPLLAAVQRADDMRLLTDKQFNSWVAGVHAFCVQAHTARKAQTVAGQTPSSETSEPPSHAAPDGRKPGRVADPEMEVLRLRKLELECAAIERNNRIETGEWLAVETVWSRYDSEFGGFRHSVHDVLSVEQPATLTGRSQDEITALNRKTYESLLRRLRTVQERMCAGGPKQDFASNQTT